MNRTSLFSVLTRAATACLIAAGASAHATPEAFPQRPIRVIVPYPAGGVGDVLTRILVEKLKPALDVTMTVENKPGGGAVIGTDAVIQAPADGYTWLIGSTSNTSNMSFMSGNRQDITRDVAAVARFGIGVNSFAVPSGSPASSVREYVAMAKDKPGALMYGSGGVGSSQFLGFELLKRASGIKVDPVHYKGAPPILTDLASGRISASFVPAAVARSQAQAGRIRILAVANEERLSGLADTPTMAEAGFPEASVSPWFAVMVPAGTPRPIVERIAKEIGKAMAAPDVKERFATLGAVPAFLGTAETEAMLRSEVQTWRALAASIESKAK